MKKLILLTVCFLAFANTVSAQCTFKILVDTVYHPNCFGQSTGAINLKTSNAQLPVTYKWNTSDIGQRMSSVSAGKYSVTATDNLGCRDSILDIKVFTDTPFISFIGIKSASATMGATAIIVIKQGADKDTIYARFNGAGPQNILIVDKFGCSYSYRVTIVLNASNELNIEGLEKFEIIQHSSNNAQVLIQFNEEKNCELNVFTTNGQLVHNQSLSAKKTTLNISDLPTGLLLFSLKIKDKIIVKKVVIIN